MWGETHTKNQEVSPTWKKSAETIVAIPLLTDEQYPKYGLGNLAQTMAFPL